MPSSFQEQFKENSGSAQALHKPKIFHPPKLYSQEQIKQTEVEITPALNFLQPTINAPIESTTNTPLYNGFFHTTSTRVRERIKEAFAYLLVLLGSRKRLSKRGESALRQLKYLSSLYCATTLMSNEEAIQFETTFGEAYYNISQHAKTLPENKNDEQYLRYYSSFKSLLHSLD